ncbi:MAG: carbohydrate kinase [Desulfovibrio sp.]|nr:carbohydrate kinase [Desulfovibrio sp.]
MVATSNNVVVGFGEALWDMLPDGKKIGGAPANFAYHVGQWGLNSSAVSAIGPDKLGEEIVATFEDKKLNFLLEEVDYPTGTVIVTLDDNGSPNYDIKEGVAWDNIPSTPRMMELAANTRAISFGSLAQRSAISRATLYNFLDAIPKDGNRYIVFDVNLRQNFYNKEILEESFQRCNVAKINDEELIVVSRMFGYPGIDLQDKCWLISGKYNLDILILTCGINGSYIFSRGQTSFLPTPQVEVVDTVGAGDSFSAVFMASILNGCSIPQAHQNAVTVSAYVCTQAGAMPPIPPEVRDRVAMNS